MPSSIGRFSRMAAFVAPDRAVAETTPSVVSRYPGTGGKQMPDTPDQAEWCVPSVWLTDAEFSSTVVDRKYSAQQLGADPEIQVAQGIRKPVVARSVQNLDQHWG